MKKIGYGAILCMVAALWGCLTASEVNSPSAQGGLLPIEGAYNVRDIGGYPGGNGKKVKYGKLIRSGDLNLLTAQDKDYLFEKIGIKTVVDFRSKIPVVVLGDNNEFVLEPAERNNKADISVVPADITVVDDDTAIAESVVVPDYESILSDSTNYPNADAVIEAVKKGYKRMAVGISGENPNLGDAKKQYKKFFETLLSSNGEPVLYHCSAGKDRTGLATALLLSALGVPREVIIDDYLKSAPLVEEKYSPVAPYVAETLKGQLKQLRTLGAVLNGAYGENAKRQAETQLAQTTRQRMKLKVMQSVINGNPQIPLETAASTAESQVSGMTNQFNNAVAQTKTQAIQLAQIPDTQWTVIVEQKAKEAGEKVQPLLTVKREYIEAVFAALKEEFGTSEDVDGIVSYLKASNGLALSDADISKLKVLYLE